MTLNDNETPLEHLWFDSPLGVILAAATSEGVCLLHFEGPVRLGDAEEQAILRSSFPKHRIVHAPESPLLNRTKELVVRYLREAAPLPPLPLDTRLGTPFQQSVWKALCEIPFGETRSYSEIAKAIGRPQAPRAVGQACGRNPVAIIIPCHRAVGAGGRLGGYAGGLHIKERLLDLEKRE